MFVVIQTGGKQINVSYGQEIFIEKIAGKAKDKVIFDKILMIDQQFGKPFLKGAEVHGEIIKQDKAKKIRVFKYKPKKNSKTMYGHRQPYTKVLITDILLAGKSIVDKTKKLEPVIKDEVKAKVTAEPAVVVPTIEPTTVKIKAETKTKVITEPEVVAPSIKPTKAKVIKEAADTTETDSNKTVVVEGNIKTIYDHKNMTVKVINEDDDKNTKK